MPQMSFEPITQDTDKPTELSSLLTKKTAMDNVQNCDSYVNIPSSQTYR
jgi:hypothetical protein